MLYPNKRHERAILVTNKGIGGATKVVLDPASFGINEKNTDRWKLHIPIVGSRYLINSSGSLIDDAEIVLPIDNNEWNSEFVTLGTVFRIWKELPTLDFGILVAAYCPTRVSL